MGQLTGKTTVSVDGTEYTLFLGFSGLAELQDKHGQDFLQELMSPEGAGEERMPPMAIVRDLVLESFERFHPGVADRWLVDDILAQNPDAVSELIKISFGQSGQPQGEGGAPGNGKGPKKKRP